MSAVPPLSLLSIVELGMPEHSIRGITQSLAPIDQATNLKRTINGELDDVSDPAFRKFQSTIQCKDFASPGLDGVWPGQILTVHCVIERCVEGSTSTAGFDRPPVPNSIREWGGFTFYRPIIVFRVIKYAEDFDEYPGDLAWQLELEEV